uniref:G-protein coupled receptors family 3 profile domain-containing protein n=1 Tax=Xiphophorus couchianus TaxID=32473 RepID=A0A3B5MAI5_9TELE
HPFSYTLAPSCGTGLNPEYRYLCDRRAAWGIVLETLASAGFLLSIGLLLGLLLWTLCACVSSRHSRSGTVGGSILSVCMFLLATAGIFAITFSFIIGLTPQTCPTRVFLFGVLFALAFSCLLARCLAMLGFAAARGWGEPGVALGLFAVQVIISTEWLIIVLVRDEKPCEYSQTEFAMLLILYTGPINQQWRAQATTLCFTLLLSACIWVVWIAMLTRGNPEVDRRPVWDDPVLSIALVANGWALVIGHGLAAIPLRVRLLHDGKKKKKENILHISTLRISTSAAQLCNKLNEHTAYPEHHRVFQEIDPNKDYTIPRPQTTNFNQPYDEYYGEE